MGRASNVSGGTGLLNPDQIYGSESLRCAQLAPSRPGEFSTSPAGRDRRDHGALAFSQPVQGNAPHAAPAPVRSHCRRPLSAYSYAARSR